MATDWRRLFDELHIQWTDKGPNSRRGNVNVKCPFCGSADPSEHMMVAENGNGYYCHRSPQLHSGKIMPRLLMQFGLSHYEAINLLNRHNTLTQPVDRQRIKREPGAMAQKWNFFRPAQESEEMLNYLFGRGFQNPAHVCIRYDLKYSPVGRWAKRLLIPIKIDGETISWTGRAIRPNPALRYDMPPVEPEGLVYLPREPQPNMVIVEGPMDALKICAATEHLPIGAIALNGLGVNPSKILRLVRILSETNRRLITLDDGITTQNFVLINELATLIERGYSARLPIPNGFDDPGEMPYSAIVDWLTRALRPP